MLLFAFAQCRLARSSKVRTIQQLWFLQTPKKLCLPSSHEPSLACGITFLGVRALENLQQVTETEQCNQLARECVLRAVCRAGSSV